MPRHGGLRTNHVDNSYTAREGSSTLCPVHWDRLFEDLEDQLASEWESERAALDAESERLRISRLELRDRLRVVGAAGASATIDLPGRHRIRAGLRALGADWIAVAPTEHESARAIPTMILIPLQAVRGIGVDHGMLLASLERADGVASVLHERMTLGFVLRDLARRRVAVRVIGIDGSDVHGTIDRAGADHLDLALHDPGAARLAAAVRGFVMIPLHAIAWVQTSADQIP